MMKMFKEDKEFQKQEAAIEKGHGEEFKRIKMQFKRHKLYEKKIEQKKRALLREKNEQKVKTQFDLIYPRITYEQEYFILDNWDEEEKKLQKEID
jgi:hypothetical protein